MRRLLLLAPLLFVCSIAWGENLSPDSDYCVFRTPFKCYDCNSPEHITVGSKKECLGRCPNRDINFNGSGTGDNYVVNCVLKECPPDRPLRGYYGGCYSCDDPQEDASWLVDNCEVCANRHVGTNGLCEFKDGRPLNRNRDDALKMQPKQKCPPDKPLQQWNNECFPCDVPIAISIDSAYHWGKKAELDAVCPDRIIIAGVGGNPPSYPPCPKKYPIMDSNGFCYSCDDPYPIDLRNNADYCARFCVGKRYVEYESSCLLCPQDKSGLNERECAECGGKFTDNKCE